MVIKADKSTEFGDNTKSTSVENFVNVVWQTFRPTPAHCKSCRASIAQEIREGLKGKLNELSVYLPTDIVEGFIKWEQQFWQKHEVK